MQAFRAGSALGLQFHPELDAGMLDLWLSTPDMVGDLSPEEVDEIRAAGAEHLPGSGPRRDEDVRRVRGARAGSRMTDPTPDGAWGARRAPRPVRARPRLACRPGPGAGGPVRPPGPAAVLVLFGALDATPSRAADPVVARDLDVLLQRRSRALGHHAGQIAFPGGRLEPSDAGPREAAVREAVEEVGLDASGVEVLGTLPPLPVPVSNHLVTPVPAWWTRPSQVAAVDHAETVDVFRVPVADLLEPANRASVEHTRWGRTVRTPAFTVDGMLVWGFTGHRARQDVRRSRLGRAVRRAPHRAGPLTWCIPSPRSRSPPTSRARCCASSTPTWPTCP